MRKEENILILMSQKTLCTLSHFAFIWGHTLQVACKITLCLEWGQWERIKEKQLREESNCLLGESRGEKFSPGPHQSMSPKWEESGERVYRAWIFVMYAPSKSCRIRGSHSKSSFIHLLFIDEPWRIIFEIQNFSSLPLLRFLVPNNKKSLSDFLFPHFQSNPNKRNKNYDISWTFCPFYFFLLSFLL